MRIGIDIDGVLTDIERWQLDYGSKFYFENYNKPITNHKGYETNEIFDVESKYDDIFWDEYFKDYCVNVSPRVFSAEVIEKLKTDGNEIYIITARGSHLSHSSNVMSIEENRNIVIDWLKKNGIYYDKIIFSPEDKLTICTDNNIDIMIEDKPKNIIDISTKIPVICFHAGYNENCSGNNIIRCYSWYDIYYKITTTFPKLIYKEINKDNVDIAIKVQNKIFPNENAAYNYYEAVYKVPYRKELIYYLVYDKEKIIGISGLYSHLEYPFDAWLAWYGVLEEYRNQGYGKRILQDYEKLARSKGYKHIRLYTDEIENKNAINLYKKFGMIGEIYNNEKEKLTEDFISTTWIFSKSLTEQPCELWNNKYLGITENIIKEKKNITEIKKEFENNRN